MKIIKSRRMTGDGHVALKGKKRNAYSVLVRKHKQRGNLEDLLQDRDLGRIL
jgi:hypothetical protein